MSRERLHFAMPRPVPPGRFRRVPPVMFLAVLAALELGLAWVVGAEAFALPAGAGQMLAGMIAAIAAFALFAYGCKLARRPSVMMEELAILPGRAGVGAAMLSLYLLGGLVGATLSIGAGRLLLILGFLLHGWTVVAMLPLLRDGPPERRMVSPDWHLSLAGLAVAAQAGMLLGWPVLAWLGMPAAIGVPLIWMLSVRQLLRLRVPAPLRPLLALHLAPVPVLATVLLAVDATTLGAALAWLALVGVLAMLAGGRWLLADGFSAFWGAPALALSATAAAWVALWMAAPGEAHRLIAGVLLVLATLTVLPVLALVLREWMQGRLPARSNAAIA
ncbi:tellurium resistance protein [Paracoccus sp. MC1854]|uniref:tellurium resistance protein n=1 Tax=Paracoccus sp. MC1854 TaxID=2760306 RepID=UPI0016018EAF|nr:tellurium resistance protein [Paracoccus sp. MC1854]MBB1491383.1 tellurium resistance protein [Paracoccus sp. MC1854]